MGARKIISFVLKLIVVVSSFYGVFLAVSSSPDKLLFFTIQSNIWIGVVCLVGIVMMIAKTKIRRWMYSVKLVFTVSITLTGVVYCALLAPMLGNEAYSLVSVLTHVVVPAASVLDFAVYDYPGEYRKRVCLLATIPPFYYLGFASVGYVLNWEFNPGQNYPYFFLNWGSDAGALGFSDQPPYIGVVYYVMIMIVFVIAVGALYILLAYILNKIFDSRSKRKRIF